MSMKKPARDKDTLLKIADTLDHAPWRVDILDADWVELPLTQSKRFATQLRAIAGRIKEDGDQAICIYDELENYPCEIGPF